MTMMIGCAVDEGVGLGPDGLAHCRKCGTGYEPMGTTAHRQGCCGETCRRTRTLVEKVCLWCGVTYATTQAQRGAYCCESHRHKARYRRKTALPAEPRVRTVELTPEQVEAVLAALWAHPVAHVLGRTERAA